MKKLTQMNKNGMIMNKVTKTMPITLMQMNMANKERYCIVLKKFGTNSLDAERFYVPDYEGYLPFFISGD